MRDVASLRVLAVDTSSAITAVAVVAGDRVLSSEHAPSEARHGSIVLPRIQAVLEAAALTLDGIDLLAVGVGPGSFTGLRVGLATVKGLAFALDKPVRGVASPEAIACSALERAEQAAVLIDAFKGEVYAGVFRRAHGGGVEPIVPLFHASPDEAARRVLEGLDPAASTLACGDGVRRYEAEIRPIFGARAALADPSLDVPRGEHVARLAMHDFARLGPSDLATLEPSYVRGSDARLPDRPLAVE